MIDKQASMKIGKAGELRVASELLLRGFKPALTLEIDEADIILRHGLRIQVKTSSRNKNNSYTFTFKGWKRTESGDRKQEKHELQNIDFVILWAIDDNEFFIIPAGTIRARKASCLSISFPGQKTSKTRQFLLPYKNQWDLLWSGR